LKKVSENQIYSELLIRFIEPLLEREESEASFLEKAKAGMIAWNYCVSEENNLKGNAEMSSILKGIYETYPDAKKTLDMLIERKQMYFPMYSNFIFDVRINIKPEGTKTLYVESAPADKLPKS